MRLLYLLLTALFLTFQGGLPALAQAPGLAAHLGPLAGLVTLGQDGEWTDTLEGGWFNMINRTEPNGLRYYITDFPPTNGGGREVRVNTVLRGFGSEVSYAGLVFDWKSHSEYTAFLIGSDGSVMAVQRGPDGYESFPAEEGIRARMDGSDVLVVRESGNQLEMILNGETVFNADSDTGFTSNIGVVAAGMGRMAFTGFSVTTTPGNGAPAAPPPGGGAAPFPAPAGGTPAPAPAPNPAPAQGLDLSAEDQEIVKAVLGTTLSVFMHELAHALIGETGLPATGPEEDTADAFSAIMLAGAVGMETPGQDNSWAEQMVEYGALFWYFSGQAQQGAAPGADDWQDEHAPDLKRFRNSFCLMYGMTPERYSDVADAVGFDARARARCVDDSAKQLNAWMQILATIERSGGPGTAGQQPANAPGGSLRASFADPGDSGAGQVISVFMGQSGLLQQMLDSFARQYVLPRDVPVRFENCPDINAWYDPDAGSITLCYALFDLTAATVLEGVGMSTGTAGGSGPATSPAQAQPLNDAENYMLGAWNGRVLFGNTPYQAVMLYNPDRTYGMKFDSPYGEIVLAGNWRAEVYDENILRVYNDPVEWEPKQICDAQNNCQENDWSGVTVTDLLVLDQNSFSADSVSWQRIQQ